MSGMFNSVEKDTILRALSDLRDVYSNAEVAKERQRLSDLQAEVERRRRGIDDAKRLLADLEEAAGLVQAVAPDLAYAFTIRANVVREQIKKLNPADLEHKMVGIENDLAVVSLLGATLSTDYKELFEE